MGRGESCQAQFDIERFGVDETVAELDYLAFIRTQAKEKEERELAARHIREEEEAKLKGQVLALSFEEISDEQFAISPIVNPYTVKKLLEANMTRLDERTFSLDLSIATAHHDLHDIFINLPGEICYDPDEAREVLKSGSHPASNYSSIASIHFHLRETSAGQKLAGLYNIIASRFKDIYTSRAKCRDNSLIEIDGKDRDDLLIRFFTCGPSQELKLFSRAPDLNLLSEGEIKPPVVVSAKEAQKIHKAALTQGWLVSGDIPSR
jgi:hypothetical protein